MVSTAQGNVLILGAGLVTSPMVEYLLSIPGVKVTVATRTVSKAEKLIGDHPNGTAQRLLSSDQEALHEVISKSDVVVSLLPAPQHPIVAEHCFQLKKHLVTTSYVSDKMEAFHDQAKAAGLLFLNECGLDPGIDHMSAMKIIHQVHDEGGKVTGFRSLCGGLPAPEANNNPWGYKFSWSPKGVVRAGSNPGRFMIDKDTMDIPGKELFSSCERIDIHAVGEFECYPNRNSLPYVEKYQIPETRTMFRGTLRNLGHCASWYHLSRLGLLADEKQYDLKGVSPRAFLAKLIGIEDEEKIEEGICSFLNIHETDPLFSKFRFIEFFSTTPLKLEQGTAADVLTEHLLEHLKYDEGERDMCVLHHIFDVTRADGSNIVITSTLDDYGIPYGHTSMARTVSLPAAMAVKLLLEERLKMTGVRIPVWPQLYEPIMTELETVNIKFIEREKSLEISESA